MDLDGTLLRGDLLWEGLIGLLRASPLALLAVPVWLFRGKARLKQRLAEKVDVAPEGLPFRQSVRDHMDAAHRAGRKIVLASASPMSWVRAVAEHLGRFDGVLASEAQVNLRGSAKLDAIREMTQGQPFEYVGDSSADLSVWSGAAVVTLVHRNARLERGLPADAHPQWLEARQGVAWMDSLREMRPVQWIKNGLVFAPLILAHEAADTTRALATVVAFLAFCVVASAGYVFNDLMDMQSDRGHPTKRLRPVASGAVSIPGALGLLAGLIVVFAGFATFLLSPSTTLMLVAYLGLTLAYSYYFKQQLLLDALVLAGLYTHRVLTGGIAADVTVSPWLLVFSGFLFLSLAFVKRFTELQVLPEGRDQQIERRAYRSSDLATVEIMGLSCAFMSVLVLCLFVSGGDVVQLYSEPALLWAMVPIMLYWVARIWMLARRGELHSDPVLFAVRDRPSYVCGALLVLVVVAARL